jgi:hypothetical protein
LLPGLPRRLPFLSLWSARPRPFFFSPPSCATGAPVTAPRASRSVSLALLPLCIGSLHHSGGYYSRQLYVRGAFMGLTAAGGNHGNHFHHFALRLPGRKSGPLIRVERTPRRQANPLRTLPAGVCESSFWKASVKVEISPPGRRDARKKLLQLIFLRLKNVDM